MARLTRRLAEYESDTLLALELRSAGTYDIESLIEGNSILSTVFVSSISVGGKVSAFYWDETTGEENGEFYQLASHKDVIANNTIDRLTVTRIHNKPRLRVTVTGSATFSVYITVVNSFASDLDAALKYEDEVVDFNQDKGIPIAGIDQATNTFHLLRTNNGYLQVELAGGGITDLDIRNLVFADDKVDVSGSSVTVSATNLDIRDLTHASDSVKIGDGTDFLAVNTDGSINVVTAEQEGQVNTYATSAALGNGSVTTHDHIVASGKTFLGETVLVGARGAVKVRVGTFDGTTFVPKMCYFQDPKENRDHQIQKFKLLGDGTAAIRIEITNLDGASSDVYSNLQGNEI